MLTALALATHFMAREHWKNRIPSGWSWESSFVGIATPVGPSGLFPRSDTTVIYDRALRVVEGGHSPDRVVIADSYRNRDPRTGKLVYDYNVQFKIDPRTGQHLAPYRDDHLVFPRNTERRTYSMRANYLKGVPLAFAGTDEVEGLHVYRFSYAGAMEYTHFYRGTGEEPAMLIPSDQEIRCWDDQYEITFWVEPMTGFVVKLAEACNSADVLVDRGTGAFRANVLRWSAESTGNDVVARVEDAWKQRFLMQLTLRHIPLSLLALSLVLASLGLFGWWRARRRGVA